MSIRVVCPKGHALKVSVQWAGKTGLCPVCKAPVEIPIPSSQDFSEDSILNLLGSADAARKSSEKSSKPGGSSIGDGRQQPPKKACDKCKQEIPKETTICPHCRTFIGNMEGR
jgi:RNA polymerase subunit RPABC4/transcription elongation factor Spt4